MVATLIAQMAHLERVELDAGETADVPAPVDPPTKPDADDGRRVQVRFYSEDGSIFLDGEYLIRGVAGRVLRSVLQRHEATGQIEFANKEQRLDKTLDLPAFRDNLDTRLVLLRRRLDEREAPIRIERTGRGRFRMDLAAA
jgi:hypothetical protein